MQAKRKKMGVTNNLYLLSKSSIKKDDVEKIEVKLEEVSKKLHQRIVEKSNDKNNLDGWKLEEVKGFFKIEFRANNWFIGDEDFFFYEDENGKIEIGEFAKDELEYNAICPMCNFNLYDKVLKIVVEKYKNQQDHTQVNLLFNENQEGVQCLGCNMIIDKDKLTGRKIIGNFRIGLPHLLFEYLSWKEIVEFFNINGKNDFYIEHYEYP